MGRSGYTDDFDDNWGLIKWRGQVSSAIRGKRGQAFLRELRDALDAMPEKRLVKSADGEIVNDEGDCCALGSVALARGMPNAQELDSTDHELMADTFNVAHQLVQEVEWMNDEWFGEYSKKTPEDRWHWMRDWVGKKIREEVSA